MKWLSLALFFFTELLLSALRVAWLVMQPKLTLRPRIIAYPLTVTSDAQITLLANMITLTPGTLSIELSPDRKKPLCPCHRHRIEGGAGGSYCWRFRDQGSGGVAMIGTVTTIALILLDLACWRRFSGSSAARPLPDRILGLDTITILAIGVIGVFAIRTGLFLYVDIAIALALCLRSTAAFARYLLSRGRP